MNGQPAFVTIDGIPIDIADRVEAVESVESALERAEALVIVTRWDEYLGIPKAIRRAGVEPLVVDGRRMLDPLSVGRYTGIGY